MSLCSQCAESFEPKFDLDGFVVSYLESKMRKCHKEAFWEPSACRLDFPAGVLRKLFFFIFLGALLKSPAIS